MIDLVEVLDELRTLLKVAANLNNLLDVVIGGQLRGSDVDLNEVLQEVLDTKETNQFSTSTTALGILTLASFWTSFGQVAENISVCLSGRI